MSERAEKAVAAYIPVSVKQLAEIYAAVEGISIGEWIARAVIAYHQQQEERHGPIAARTERLISDIVGKFSKPRSDDATPTSGV